MQLQHFVPAAAGDGIATFGALKNYVCVSGVMRSMASYYYQPTADQQ